jgi:hypothetical protein
VGRIATYACDGFSAPLGWLPTCRHSCRARCVKYPLVTQTPWPPPYRDLPYWCGRCCIARMNDLIALV